MESKDGVYVLAFLLSTAALVIASVAYNKNK